MKMLTRKLAMIGLLTALSIGASAASKEDALMPSKECSLNITYKGHKQKSISIELESKMGDEELYTKFSGSLSINILVKKEAQGSSTTMSVWETQTNLKIGTASNTLTVGSDDYTAVVFCLDRF